MHLRITTFNRPLFGAITLVAGEACGFALREAAFLWPWLAFLLGLAFLAAYGWKVRGLFLPAVFAVGVVLAARTEAARLHVIDGTRFTATPPPMSKFRSRVLGGFPAANDDPCRKPRSALATETT